MGARAAGPVAPRASLLVFLATALVALLFWLALPAGLRENTASDYDDFYEPVARRLLGGLGPSLAPGVPATQYPPGYPLLLAASMAVSRLLGASESLGPLLLGFVSTGLAAVLILALARALWGPRLALAAPLAWAAYLPGLWLAKQPSSELPFLVLFLGGLWLAWRAERTARAAAAGLCLGAAMLVRPIALAAPLVVGAGLVLARRRDRRAGAGLAAVLLLASLAAVLPWEVWVYARTGRVVALATGGLPSIRDGLSFGGDSKQYRRPVALPARAEAAMRAMRPDVAHATSVSEVTAAVLETWRSQPLGTTMLFACKAARSWYATDSGRNEGAVLCFQLLYLTLAGWGGVVAWRRGRAGRALALGIAALVVYFWGMTILVLSIARYMVPAMALLCVLVPGALVGLTDARAPRPSEGRA